MNARDVIDNKTAAAFSVLGFHKIISESLENLGSMLLQLPRLSSSLREPFDIDDAYLQRKSILQTYVKPRNSTNSLDGSELARRIVPQWDKASVDLRQAYKKFVEAVGELVGGGVPTEEFHELAVTVCHLFGVPEEKFEADKKTSEKKLLLQKVLGVPMSDSNLQKVATVAHNVYKLQPDDQRTSLGVDVYATESDENIEFGWDIPFREPGRFLVDMSLVDVNQFLEEA